MSKPKNIREELIRKATITTEALAGGGALTDTQSDAFAMCLKDIKHAAQPSEGPPHRTGPPCAVCDDPLGCIRYCHRNLMFCSHRCEDKWVLANEREMLYVGERENRWLVQDLEDRPAHRFDINRALWQVAFRPLWDQNTFDFAYGGYENDVFSAHPYYWGDCTCGHADQAAAWCRANKHAASCYYTAQRAIPWNFADLAAVTDEKLKALCRQHGIPWNDGKGCRVHCTCGYAGKWQAFYAEYSHAADCKLEVPNFVYKPTGLELHWYKYPFRGTTANQRVESYDVLCEMVKHCVCSL